jgi:hypothetical protein
VDAGKGAAVNPASGCRVIVTSVIGLTALSVRAHLGCSFERQALIRSLNYRIL